MQSIELIKAKRRRNPDKRTPIPAGTHENDEAPDPWEESEDFALGSISDVMVGDIGLEPMTSALSRQVGAGGRRAPMGTKRACTKRKTG